MTDRLFDVPEPEPPKEPLSYTRRVTIRNRELLDRGLHPITREGLRQPVGEETCGSCAHHKVVTHNRSWHKCRLRDTASIATDLRLSWPACVRWVGAVGHCSFCGQAAAGPGPCSFCKRDVEVTG